MAERTQPTSVAPRLELDFVSDFLTMTKSCLTNSGYAIEAGQDDIHVLYRYLDVRHRLVRIVPRQVHCPHGFKVPDRHKSGFGCLMHRVTKGKDLTAHLSKRTRQSAKYDGLLDDWDIMHFHVGNRRDVDGSVARTNDVLFARVTETDFYICGFWPHRQWGVRDILEVIHRNWPASIDKWKSPIPMRGDVPSNDDIIKLRAGGVQPLVPLSDGTVYFPIGGGITSATVGTKVVELAHRWTTWLRYLEDMMRSEYSKRWTELTDQCAIVPERMHFVLNLEQTYAVALEHSMKVKIRLAPIPLWAT